MLRRVERLLDRFLAEEAERETGGFEPWLLEAGFGEHEEAERPALELDGWRLHGAIDRVDRAADGRALVLDYKLSGSVTAAREVRGGGEAAAAALPDRRRRALGRRAGRRPLPPAARRPRSGARAASSLEEAARATSPATASTAPTCVDAEEFEELLADARAPRRRDRRPDAQPATSAATPARARACAATTSARAFCDFAPICRRDRAPVSAEDDEEEEER